LYKFVVFLIFSKKEFVPPKTIIHNRSSTSQPVIYIRGSQTFGANGAREEVDHYLWNPTINF